MVALFGAGVASFLAPCVVPLVPAYLGLVAGEAVEARDPARAVPATMLFVAGFAVLYASLGAAVGLVGSVGPGASDSVSDIQVWIQRVGGVLLVVMGLALLGVVKGPLSRERRLMTQLPKVPRAIRPVVVGIAFGAAWSPCVGPLLGAALTVAYTGAQPGRGAALLFSYSMGIGVPFLLASLGLASSPAMAARLRRIGPRLERVSGGLLVALGLLLVTDVYEQLTSYLARFTPAIGGL